MFETAPILQEVTWSNFVDVKLSLSLLGWDRLSSGEVGMWTTFKLTLSLWMAEIHTLRPSSSTDKQNDYKNSPMCTRAEKKSSRIACKKLVGSPIDLKSGKKIHWEYVWRKFSLCVLFDQSTRQDTWQIERSFDPSDVSTQRLSGVPQRNRSSFNNNHSLGTTRWFHLWQTSSPAPNQKKASEGGSTLNK